MRSQDDKCAPTVQAVLAGGLMSTIDYRDCAEAIRTTVSLLETSGVPSHVIAATLLSAAIESWRRCAEGDELTRDEIRELVERVAIR